MIGMLQVITWLGGLYLIVKGIEVLQIGLASSRPDRKPLIVIGLVTLGICVAGATFIIWAQDNQAEAVGTSPY